MGEVIKVSQPGAIEKAVEVLQRGGVVAFPTDTVYGVAAHGLMASAVARLFQVKGRPLDRAIPLLLADPQDLDQVARDIPPLARELADLFWPGPLSLVLWAKPDLPPEVTAGGQTVAVRIPDHDVPQELARLLGAPLAATSANRSGGTESSTAEEVLRQIGDAVDIIVDGGPCPGGVPSTVLDLTTDPPRILRQGPVTHAMLVDLIPHVRLVSGRA